MLGSKELREAEERNGPQRLLSMQMNCIRNAWSGKRIKNVAKEVIYNFQARAYRLSSSKRERNEKPKKASTIYASSSNFSLQ